MKIPTVNNGNIIDVAISEEITKGDFIRIKWQSDLGFFGGIDIWQYEDGSLKISTETFGKEFAKQLFCELIDKAKLID